MFGMVLLVSGRWAVLFLLFAQANRKADIYFTINF